jgi:hypothetical protein
MRTKGLLITAFLLSPLFLFSGEITHSFTFSTSSLSFSTYEGYDVVTLKHGVSAADVGKPSIPFIIANFVIPATAEVMDVKVISKETEEIPGFFNICPVQVPRPIALNEVVPFTEPDMGVYVSDRPYPEKDIDWFPSGSEGGYRVCGIFLYPLKYIPVEKRLILTERIDIELIYKEDKHTAVTLSKKQREVFSLALSAEVVNWEDISRFSPPVRVSSGRDVNYAIVTGADYAADWQKLADWKSAAGYSAQVFSTDWIYTNYTGYDNPEKLRNFFKDYYTNHGLIYGVLGGDVQIVPERDAYSDFYSPYFIASDYYYSDLDGTWDGNGNHLYGERTGDDVDGYFDIYVGRLPIDDTVDIHSVLGKDSVYTYAPPDSFIKKILLVSDTISPTNNAIMALVPPDWEIKNIGSDSLVFALNMNHNLCHVDAPVTINLDSLNNIMPTILNSTMNYIGNFDEVDDCFGEAIVNLRDHGCSAVILNSRYGWGGSSQIGPSGQLDTCFYDVLFTKDTLNIGIIHGATKNHYRNLIWSQGVWHYCGLELNLFGDPEMSIHLQPLVVEEKDSEIGFMGPEFFTIQPNPFTMYFTIAFHNKGQRPEVKELKIYDITGKEVMYYKLRDKEKKISMDTRNLPGGIYFIRIKAGDVSTIRKVVKVN